MKNSKALKQIARDNIKIDDKQLDKILAKKLIKPFYFTDRILNTEYNITLDNHQINYINTKITRKPNYLELDKLNVNKLVLEKANTHAGKRNQYKFEDQILFSAMFDKRNEDDQVLDEVELYNGLNTNRKLTESYFDNIDVRSQLEEQIQNQQTEGSGWSFDKINLMTIYFFETTELNSSIYVKFPTRSSAILNIEMNDKFCLMDDIS